MGLSHKMIVVCMEHFFAENAITIEHRDWISKSKVQVVYIRRLYRNFVYKFSTSFSFSLKMFLSSPRVDSIFSREYCCSPSAPRSLATHELSSLTVLSRSFHSLTRVSTFLHQSSETALTFS